jgi:hypothetical protein
MMDKPALLISDTRKKERKKERVKDTNFILSA